ncbi:MAG TPA: DUF3488 and transglutaminase-like domain-containing protein [Thermoanaerobaculia bacterium]|nr:DUF3488 and transglutaminase-like domain-containing protein [Thermoanaerobaculia bacterium]
MSFAAEKRRLLGWLALLAPLPLPFNDVLAWPVLIVYWAAVVVFLRRAASESARWLPLWAVNLLGGLYLGAFVFDLLVLSAGRPVGPVIHVLLFAGVVKLFSLERERDKWQAVVVVVFLFLASLATAADLLIVVYLVVFVAMALHLLARFAFLHVLASFGEGARRVVGPPLGRFIVVATVAVLVLGVPLFVVLPRVRAPYLVGPGGANRGMEVAGFTDEVTLDSIGFARDNPEVVMRARFRGGLPASGELRLKVAAHDVFKDGVWRALPETGENLRPPRGETEYFVSRDRPVSEAELFLKPVLGSRLALPVETARLSIDGYDFSLLLTPVGTVSRHGEPRRTMRIQAWLADRPILAALPPAERAAGGPLDPNGVTEEIRALASQVMGSGGPRERALTLERWFQREFEYTTDFVGRGSDQPIEDFLLRFRSGHCEYFATATVLMLRSQGIPARLVTGYLGGDRNRFEGSFVVRQSNAHAWVEAWLPDGGWAIFDPTPAAGRPAVTEAGIFSILTETWEFLVFRWDRYVVSYSFLDQLRLFWDLRQWWGDFWRSLSQAEPAAPPRAASRPEAEAAPAEAAPPDARRAPWLLPVAGLGVLALVVALALLLRWRRQPTATELYLGLRRLLAASAGRSPELELPLRLAALGVRRFPAAAEGIEELVGAYLAESFAGRSLPLERRQRLAGSWRQVREVLIASRKGKKDAAHRPRPVAGRPGP